MQHSLRQLGGTLSVVLVFPALLALAGCEHPLPRSIASTPARNWSVAQEDSGTGQQEVTPDQVEKYIKVYQAMQSNRTLTVEQAAAQQSLSVAQFRNIEDQVERDGVLRERVRRELLKTAQQRGQVLKASPLTTPH